jgi:hypothetical protein
MNEQPPNRDPADEVDEFYRRASALDVSRPSDSVRKAVLAHAARLAAERTSQSTTSRRTSNSTRWWAAVFGTLAAAALAGLMVLPRFLSPSAPHEAQSLPESAPLANTQTSAQAKAQTSARAQESASAPPELARAQRAAPAPPVRHEAPQSAQHAAAGAVAAREAAQAPAQDTAADIQGGVTEARSAAPRGDSETRRLSGLAALAPTLATATARAPASAQTALRRAAETGDLPALQTLLDRRVDIDSRDEMGRTALMLATLHGRTDAVDMLLDHGADPNVADSRGSTPLQIAIAGNAPAIVVALQRKGAR